MLERRLTPLLYVDRSLFMPTFSKVETLHATSRSSMEPHPDHYENHRIPIRTPCNDKPVLRHGPEGDVACNVSTMMDGQAIKHVGAEFDSAPHLLGSPNHLLGRYCDGATTFP